MFTSKLLLTCAKRSTPAYAGPASRMMQAPASMLMRSPATMAMTQMPVRGFAYHERVIDHYENPRNVGSFDKKSP